MAFEEIVKQVAETIQKEANARAVFAEAMKLETHVVIPVAAVHISLGGGGTGSSRKPTSELARFFGAGGGGLDVRANPVGFIHEKDGAVVFTPIEIKSEHEKEKGLPERLMAAFAAKEKVAEKPH